MFRNPEGIDNQLESDIIWLEKKLSGSLRNSGGNFGFSEINQNRDE